MTNNTVREFRTSHGTIDSFERQPSLAERVRADAKKKRKRTQRQRLSALLDQFETFLRNHPNFGPKVWEYEFEQFMNRIRVNEPKVTEARVQRLREKILGDRA